MIDAKTCVELGYKLWWWSACDWSESVKLECKLQWEAYVKHGCKS